MNKNTFETSRCGVQYMLLLLFYKYQITTNHHNNNHHGWFEFHSVVVFFCCILLLYSFVVFCCCILLLYTFVCSRFVLGILQANSTQLELDLQGTSWIGRGRCGGRRRGGGSVRRGRWGWCGCCVWRRRWICT